jgi:CheY-like chemotaxis protein
MAQAVQLSTLEGFARSGAPLKILIIEDEPFIALDLEAAVQARAHDVIGIADSVGSALALARASACDGALIDVRLRDGFTGPAIAETLKAEFGMPFAFITGNVEQLPQDRCGAVAVVEKPFSQSEITRVLSALEARVGL